MLGTVNAGDRAPSTLGPYRIVATLGRGGMGVVYQGEHQVLGTRVAIKTVHATHEGVLQCIRREMHTLARMNHPGIVRMLAEGNDSGRPWYAMELVEGVSMRARCDALRMATPETIFEDSALVDPFTPRALEVGLAEVQSSTTEVAPINKTAVEDTIVTATPSLPPGSVGPLPLAALHETLTLVRRLCVPLGFLHGEGLVHRDLKPDNVLVRPGGIPVLVDFGLATQFDGRLSLFELQASRHAEGTLSYIAPEVLKGEIADARADLYALGCMLYELLAGCRPFVGSRESVIYGHLFDVAMPLRDLAPGLSESLYELVDRLLAKNPRHRLGYAEDVATALASLGADDLPEGAPRRRARPYLYRPGFCGRGAVLERLSEVTSAISDDRGGLVLIGGESGVGKTRLMLELIRETAKHDLHVLVGECPPAGARPLEALHQPLQAIADHCRMLGPYGTQRIVGTWADVLAPYEPELASLPGVDHAEVPTLSGRDALRRLFEGLTEIVRALSIDLPVVLVLDDLQWSDALTLAWLKYLVDGDRLSSMRVAVVGTYRSEERTAAIAELCNSDRVHSLALDRLEASDVITMMCDMLALPVASPVFGSHLARHSEGNPFFVAEYLRMAVEQGIVQRDLAGQWHLPEGGADATYHSLPLPDSLYALVVRRYQDLDPEVEATLAAAAVLGREGDVDALTSLAELDEDTGLSAAAELLRRQILEEVRPGRLRFVHDKLREVAYDRISEDHRRTLHRAAAEILESRVARETDPVRRQETLEALAKTLAFHYGRAGVDAHAARYAWLAGRYAARTLAHADAVSHFEAAARILDRMPGSVDVEKMKVDVRLDEYAARMHVRSAADDGLLRLCREAEPVARRLGDPRRLTRLYAAFAGAHFARAEYDQSIDVGLRGLAEAGDDAEATAIAAYVPTIGLLQAGRILSLVELVTPILDRMERDGVTHRFLDQPYPPYIALAGGLGWALGMMGRFRDGELLLGKAMKVARATRHRYAEALTHAMLGWSWYAQDDGLAIVREGEAAVRIAREAQLPGPEMFGMYGVGVGRVIAGDVDQGMAELEQALARAGALGYMAFRTDAYYGLALGHAARGEAEPSVAWCQSGLDFATRTGERKLEGEFHRLLGCDALRRDDADGAERHLVTARTICHAQGTRVYEARACVALGELRERQGRLEEADAALWAGEQMFRDAGLADRARTAHAQRERIRAGHR